MPNMAKNQQSNITIYLVNSFTQNGSGGNPAGVVLYPPKLTHSQKIAIAKDVGFSETAFVYVGNETDFNVEFFTPEGEVDFCGHATLAVFSTLASLNKISFGEYTQKTKAGILSVSVDANGVIMQQTLPTFRQGPSIEDVATALGISSDIITNTGLPIEIISTGLPDIIIPVQTGYLDLLRPNFSAIATLSRDFNTIGFHVFEINQHGAITAHCRNFAPLYGINEESATGSASGALGCYLVKHLQPENGIFQLEQGRAMNCSSIINVMIDCHSQMINRVCVGGQATGMGTKLLSI